MICNRTLEECMKLFSTEILEYIMQDKGIQKKEILPHDIMCKQIADYMMQPEVLERYFSCLSDDEIARLEHGIAEDLKNNKYEGSYEIPMLLCQSEYAFRFSNKPEDEELFWFPYDVAEAFMNMKSDVFTEKRKSQNHFLSCLMAVDTFYGQVPLRILAPVMEKSVEEATEMITALPQELNHYIVNEEIVYHRDLYLEDCGLACEQKDVPYYIPDEEELEELGRWGYLPTRAEMRVLVNYLIVEKNMDVESAEYVAMWIQKMTAAGGVSEDIYEYLEEFGTLMAGERPAELAELLEAFQRNTRKLVNRGYTDMELFTSGWQQK